MTHDNWDYISPSDITEGLIEIGTLIRVGHPSGEWVPVQSEEDFENLPSHIQQRWTDFEEACCDMDLENNGFHVFVWDDGIIDYHRTGVLVDANEKEWTIMFIEPDGHTHTSSYHIDIDHHLLYDPNRMYGEPTHEGWHLFLVQEKDLPSYH
jgi:hypothetical protein